MNRKYIFFLILLLFPIVLFGQPGEDGDPGVPISGIEILIALGGVLGLKKYFRNKKSSDS